ncbi:MAG: NapC/NirT family cytochrome c [Coriobacteriia bacterium]
MNTRRDTDASARGNVPVRLIAAIAVSVVVLGVAFAGIARATELPSFCGSACHEMGPFHSAWTTGAHKNISCVECHVDVGTIARMEHKVVALKEVATHVTGDPKFPMEQVTPVPSERCKRCHPNVALTSTGFSHAEHANRGECVMCHATVGHDVSISALKEAGVYNDFAKTTFDTTKTAVVDRGKANLAGHKTVPCSRCHDMAAAKCSECHKPKHVDRGKDCTVCHATGAKFVFTHPVRADCGTCHKPKSPAHTWKGACTDCHKSGPGVNFNVTHPADTNCESCHPRPAKHRAGTCAPCHKKTGVSWAFAHPDSGDCEPCHARPANHKSGSCSSCHHSPGKNWAYAHPGSKADCTSCHPRPSGHRSGSCTSCHTSVGKSWNFSHPGSKSDCTSCHARPSGHRSGSCTSCHASVGKSWKFSHPGSSSNCASCHSRPGGHNSGSCQDCHSPGSKWTFRHTGSSSCSSCHKAPSNHYGTTCQSCHSPSKSWSSATFSHPGIPGGEHRSTSFACTKCHPGSGRGPGHFCSCHGNTTGPSD